MSNIGPIALEDANTGQVFLGGGLAKGPDFADNIADRIDDEVRKIVTYCEQKATDIIQDNRVAIDLIVEKLMDVETLDGPEFRQLLSTYTILPNKKLPYVSKLD